MALLPLKQLFGMYNSQTLKKVWEEEYIPWTKTGLLEDGQLRDIFNEYEKLNGPLTLIAIEKEFILECARRFINSK